MHIHTLPWLISLARMLIISMFLHGESAWRQLSRGRLIMLLLPIENSNAGIVADVYDLLQEYNNYIIAETYVKIEHLLLRTSRN